MVFLKTAAAFIRRDWLVHASYRASLLFGMAGALMAMVPFFFVGKLVDSNASNVVSAYGGYFPFVLLGLACSRYVTASLSAFGGVLREEQLQGTLEAMLATPASSVVILLGGAFWPFLWTTLEVILYLSVGAALFGVSFGSMNVPAAILVLALLILSLSSIGVLSACGLLLFKEADPVNWALGGLMRLVGGVYFPVALLPNWLKAVAGWFPLTYGLDGLRQVILAQASLNAIAAILFNLGIFAAAGWALAMPAFLWTIRRLKQSGTLSFR